MNENNKGFTLIELLVVIALMGIITTSITLGMIEMYEKQKDAVTDEFNNNIKRAACTYAEIYDMRNSCSTTTSYCKIQLGISELIRTGFLDENDEYTSNYAYIEWDTSGLRTCTYE